MRGAGRKAGGRGKATSGKDEEEDKPHVTVLPVKQGKVTT